MKITIDHQSGFCFGVKRAIDAAEKSLKQGNQVFSLGDIVHNEQEAERLEKLGLQIINHDQLSEIENKTILFRAHGEPPSSYQTTGRENAHLIDATCPVVLKLQQRIKKSLGTTKRTQWTGCHFWKKGACRGNGTPGSDQF